MKVLGAILAGGKSKRFGSDKAVALIDGTPFIEHVHAALEPQVDAIVVCGRRWRDWPSLADLPAADQGPLGGLNAALAYAREHGFEWVMTVPVDTFPLPSNLSEMLGPGPACLAEQRLVAVWPSSASTALSGHLAQGNRSVRSWVHASGARLVEGNGAEMANINALKDLALVLERRLAAAQK